MPRPADDVDLAREVLGTTLRGLIAGAGISVRGFAAAQGVDESHIRALLDPVHSGTLPSRAKLARILSHLGVAEELRQDLERALTDAQSTAGARNAAPGHVTEDDLIPHVQTLRVLHDQATHAADPARAKLRYAWVARESYTLMARIDPAMAPVLYAEVCLLAHDCYSILGRPVRALYAARRAEHCTTSWEPGRHPGGSMPASAERIGQLMVNAIRAAGLVYRAAGLHEQSGAVARHALHVMRRHHIDEYVVSTASKLDRLYALAGARRFTLHQADAMAADMLEEIADRPDPYAVIVRARAREGQARAYLAYARIYALTPVRARKTEALLTEVLATLGATPAAGPSHRACAFETMASYCDAVGDVRSRDVYLHQAYAIAEQAGLAARLERLRGRIRTAPAPFQV